MKVEQRIINRFDTILTRTDELFAYFEIKTQGRTIKCHGPSGKLDVRVVGWKLSALHLLEAVFGTESVHYKEFLEISGNIHDRDVMYAAIEVLKAAKDDYQNGYLFDTRVLIEAEVFADFLEQAEHLLSQGYYQPAAVIAGCVLEDGLRKLCDRNKSVVLPPKATINTMNDALAKAGVYLNFTKDKISSLAKLRNHAAHGQWDKFGKKEIEDMIRDVRRFMEDHFS